MFDNNHNAPASPVVSGARAWLLALAALFAIPAFGVDGGVITVGSLKGEVQVTMNGAAHKVRVGSVLSLPATVRTGRDGAIELRQGATTLSVGPDTLLEFPALEKPGAPIDRVIQPRGNTFYDVGKREGRKLRVETPYLVGVVKGTQFNVAAQDESTAISLFEGSLEIRATDDSAVVDLEAGEIATRRRGDKTINVLKMDAGKAPTPGDRPRASASGEGGAPAMAALPGAHAEESGHVAIDHSAARSEAAIADTRAPAPVAADMGGLDAAGGNAGSAAGNDSVNAGPSLTAGNADVGVVAGVSLGSSVDVNAGANIGPVDAGVNAGASIGESVEVNAGTTIAVGSAVDAGADVAASLGANAVTVDVSVSTGVDTGVAAVGADTSISVEVAPSGVSVDAGIGAQIDAGPAAVDVSAGTGVDLGGSGLAVDTGVATAIDAGPINAGVDAGASIGVGSDSVGASVDLGAAVGSVAPVIDAGIDTTVNVSTGAVDLGVSVGGLDVGVGLDLGLGDNEDATDTEGSTTDTATDTGNTGTVDVGGLLDGLLRRPGRK